MKVIIFLFNIYKLSTIYTGGVKKIMQSDNRLYVGYTYNIYKWNRVLYTSNNIIKDFSIKNDTLFVLTRKLGIFNTYVDIYNKNTHIGHLNVGQGGKYLERGKDFYLVGTVFYTVLIKNSGNLYNTDIYSAHIFCDSLITGYSGLSQNFLVVKPVFHENVVNFDTLFSKDEVPFQYYVFFAKDTMLFIGFDGNLYMLYMKDSILLKRIYTDHDGTIYFGSTTVSNGTRKYYLSTFERTYVYDEISNDSMNATDSINLIGIDFVSIGDTLYVRTNKGTLARVQNNLVNTDTIFPQPLSKFKVYNNEIYLKKGDFPARLTFDNPFEPQITILDTTSVKDFLWQDSIFVYLKNNDSLFVRKGNGSYFIDFGVFPVFQLVGDMLYYVKKDTIISFNIKNFTEIGRLILQGESIFNLSFHKGNLFVESLDTMEKNIYVRKTDTVLSPLNTYEIYGLGSYISPIKPDFCDSFMFIPYIRQGVNEYRISVLNIKNGVFVSELKGEGSITAIEAISLDSVFVLEEPYGLPDVKLSLVDFADSNVYTGGYVGVAGVENKVISDGRFLYVYTDGRLDVYLLKSLHVMPPTPFVLRSNIINKNFISIYSLYNTTKKVGIDIYNFGGLRLFHKVLNLSPCDNDIYFNKSLKTGPYILRIQEEGNLRNYTFKFIYMR